MDAALTRRLLEHFDPLTPAVEGVYVAREEEGSENSAGMALRLALLGRQARACLLVGAMGTGKSTELAHLAIALPREESGFVSSLLRLQDQCEPESLTAPQVLFLLGVAALRIPSREPPGGLKNDLQDAYRQIVEPSAEDNVDVAGLIERLRPAVEGLAEAGGLPMVGTLLQAASGVARALPRLPLPGQGRKLNANEAPVTRLAEAVRACMDWAEGQIGQRRLVFFVDGLDRLSLDGIDNVFGSGVLSLASCPVVYSAPLDSRYMARFNALSHYFEQLPLGNFPIFEKEPDGRHDPIGFEAMRKLVQRRLHAAAVAPEAVFEGGMRGEVMDLLIEASGGLPRTLVQLADRAIRRGIIQRNADPLVRRIEAEAAVRSLEQTMVDRLEPRFVDKLLECWGTRQRPEGEDGNLLLFQNFVLAYPNCFHWYRPTPLLLRYLRTEFPDRAPGASPRAAT